MVRQMLYITYEKWSMLYMSFPFCERQEMQETSEFVEIEPIRGSFNASIAVASFSTPLVWKIKLSEDPESPVHIGHRIGRVSLAEKGKFIPAAIAGKGDIE